MRTPRFEAEVDLFSGRPNFTWSLTAQESLELLARINRLLFRGGDAPVILGYRGFIVHRMDAATPRRWLEVGARSVRITDQNGSRSYRDTEGIEEWLREQAIVHGFGALVPRAK